MADAKRTIIKLTLPAAKLAWPKLSEPDYGTKQYPNEDGEYSAKPIFKGTDKAFMKVRAQLDAELDKAIKNGRAAFADLDVKTRKKLGDITVNQIFSPLYDKDTEEETGEFECKVSMKASGAFKKGPKMGQRWHRKPQLFDALGRPIKGKLDIWSGTVAKLAVSFEEGGYFIPGTGLVGVKLQLEAAQILELKQGGEREAKDYGFGKEDTGFAYSEKKDEDEDDEDDIPDAEDDDEDDGAGDPAGSSDF